MTVSIQYPVIHDSLARTLEDTHLRRNASFVHAVRLNLLLKARNFMTCIHYADL